MAASGGGKLLPKVGTDFALNTGTNIPSIGFGTWKIPADHAKETIKKALELGFRHFDCALEYGNQEEIGNALHEIIESHQISRGDIFITSKLWNTHHRRHGAYDDLSQTLRQLKLHHLDLWLMHWPLSFVSGPKHGDDTTTCAKDQNGKVMVDETSIIETWRAMEEMYKDGKARAIGVCNFPVKLLDQLLTVCEVPPAVVQIERHPYLQQAELVEFCQKKWHPRYSIQSSRFTSMRKCRCAGRSRAEGNRKEIRENPRASGTAVELTKPHFRYSQGRKP